MKALTGQGIHPAQTGSLLSGAHISKGAIIHSGISVDQMIANRWARIRRNPSIVLACEQPMTGYHETNFSMAYSSHISWQTPDSPVPVEVYPSLAWDNLFENRGSLLQHEHSRPREGPRAGRSAARSARPTRTSWTNI